MAGLGLVKDALGRIFRVKGDSENVGEMEDTPTETYQSLQRCGSLNTDSPGKDEANHLSLQQRREQLVGTWMGQFVQSLDVHR